MPSSPELSSSFQEFQGSLDCHEKPPCLFIRFFLSTCHSKVACSLLPLWSSSQSVLSSLCASVGPKKNLIFKLLAFVIGIFIIPARFRSFYDHEEKKRGTRRRTMENFFLLTFYSSLSFSLWRLGRNSLPL